MTERVPVALDPGYDVWVGAGRDVLDAALTSVDAARASAVAVVTDDQVASAGHAARVAEAWSKLGVPVHLLEVASGEASKSVAVWASLLERLAALGLDRDAWVCAVGGGVVGDLAGFVAASYLRGVPFVQVPTTLLAMVDASVGGKTGLDLAAGKNLVGAFHQPRAVVIDTSTLATLPEREFLAGLAEVVKYGAIGDAAFFAWLETHADALLVRDATALEAAIASSCRHKAGVVARDERELGERALLNFGHTFGHALEVEAGYGEILHGEAVAIGMLLAARLSSRLGLAAAADAERLQALLQRLRLPTRIPPGLQPRRLLERMRLDKKSVSGQLRLVLWRGIGQAEVVGGVAENAIEEVLASG